MGIVLCAINADIMHAQAFWMVYLFPVPSACRGLQVAALSVSLPLDELTFVIPHTRLVWNSFVCQQNGAPTWGNYIHIKTEKTWEGSLDATEQS